MLQRRAFSGNTRLLATLKSSRPLEPVSIARTRSIFPNLRQLSSLPYTSSKASISTVQLHGLVDKPGSRIQSRRYTTPRNYDPNSPRENQTMTLPDGRELGFAEYGSPTGTPVFYFHGDVGSRIEVVEWDKAAKKNDIRIIGVDRPGMGLSSFQPDRKLLDWPKDVRELARHLGITEYRIIGVSGGGPFVLACAYAIPQNELKAAGVVAGMGLWSYGLRGMRVVPRLTWNLTSWMPGAYGKLLDSLLVPAAQNPDISETDKLAAKIVKEFREGDRKYYEQDPYMTTVLRDVLRAGFQQGSKGLVHDIKIMTRHWGFELKDISQDKVLFWYGLDDENTTPRVGRLMHKEIRQSKLTEYQGTTHFTIMGKHGDKILSELIKA
ncbi:alpha/beta-hydrolase [Xylona heveae TC161]|uniref:Alpha/beta-hydrolase n=1 Tax=Xylona heveae (strain CBS 132557 / TC161) TaxID=1328760 RepID=A0A165IYC6_XYLHT|nr:alpha/beta-hydrolase [Xylona heveae TC161]KZF25545.1 alpha/beta-hydrolase [Xylona heveae TC161]